MNPRVFFGELKRRNVYKVAVAYGVVGWLFIQVATQVFPFLEIPVSAIRFVIFATALGFPVALIIASAFELTPEGIKRAEVGMLRGKVRAAAPNGLSHCAANLMCNCRQLRRSNE